MDELAIRSSKDWMALEEGGGKLVVAAPDAVATAAVVAKMGMLKKCKDW